MEFTNHNEFHHWFSDLFIAGNNVIIDSLLRVVFKTFIGPQTFAFMGPFFHKKCRSLYFMTKLNQEKHNPDLLLILQIPYYNSHLRDSDF